VVGCSVLIRPTYHPLLLLLLLHHHHYPPLLPPLLLLLPPPLPPSSTLLHDTNSEQVNSLADVFADISTLKQRQRWAIGKLVLFCKTAMQRRRRLVGGRGMRRRRRRRGEEKL